MQRTFEYAANNRVSPATVELLIRERSKGKTLRQLGQMFGRSHERIRQILAKHDRSQVTLLAENAVAAKLGYPVDWILLLRKEGIIKPIKPGGFWLYSDEQVRQIPSLLLPRKESASDAASRARLVLIGSVVESVGSIGKKRGTGHGRKQIGRD